MAQGRRDEGEVKRSTPSCARFYAYIGGEGEERGIARERDARRRRGINHCLPASGSFNHLLSVKRESRDARKSVTRARLKRALSPRGRIEIDPSIAQQSGTLSKIAIIKRIKRKE